MAAVRQPAPPSRRTLLGLERQGLGWTLVIAAVALFFAVGLPLLDAAISTGDEPKPGAVYQVSLGVTITPLENWSTTSPSRPGTGWTEFTRAGAYLAIRANRFSGTTREAYEGVSAALDGEDGVQLTSSPETFTTRSGLPGIAGAFATPVGQGYIAVFSAHGVVAIVVAEGATAAFHAVDRELVAMIRSVEIGPA
jgi:hypothetical protein